MQMLFIRLLISLKMLLAAWPVLIKVLPMTEHLTQPRVAARLMSELQFHRRNTLNLLHGLRPLLPGGTSAVLFARTRA